MKILGTSAALFAILLSGCAAKHEMPTANTPFAGDKALSLAGNMELLAGNTTVVNKDKDANAAEMAAAAAVTNTAIIAGQTTVNAIAAGGLSAGNLGFGVGSALMFLQDDYKHLDIDMLVIMKVDASENPSSQAVLEKAFKFATNQNATRMKQIKFGMEDGNLITYTGAEKLLYVKFSTLIAPELVKRIDPTLPAGNYAAFGMYEPSFSGNHLQDNEFGGNAWINHGKWLKTLSVFNDQHEEITYKVDHVGQPNAKTLVVNYKKTGMDGVTPINKAIGVQLR